MIPPEFPAIRSQLLSPVRQSASGLAREFQSEARRLLRRCVIMARDEIITGLPSIQELKDTLHGCHGKAGSALPNWMLQSLYLTSGTLVS
jgi:hypothetical protein